MSLLIQLSLLAVATATTQTSESALALPIPHVMTHPHGLPILQTHLRPEEKLFWENYNTTTYFSVESAHKNSLYLHLATLYGSCIFIYPVYLVLCNIRHRAHLPALAVHLLAVVVSLISYWVYMGSIPALYPHNAYGPMLAILLCSTVFHAVVALAAAASKPENHDYDYIASDEEDAATRIDSGSCSIDTRDSSNSFELDEFPKTSLQSMFPRKSSNPFQKIGPVVGKLAQRTFSVLNWAHFFYFLILFPTMVATTMCIGQGKAVFNVLAHFIKGGVFFSLGLLYLARYCGAFTNKGWSWNHKFITASSIKHASSFDRKYQTKGCWTMEFIESFLILFYGCTNVFLERLASSGGKWLAKDLQHASIAFIYIGCGFCGVLTEIKLSDWRFQKAKDNFESINPTSSTTIIKAHPGYSPNPFPVLTIYWTGVLMSSHQQASELSSAIHVQWGNLFILACAFRFITYVLMMLQSPNKNLTQPARPFTELIASFSLICGGLIFMESCDPVIYSFEYYGLTKMFTLNVSLGFVALIMAWEMAVFAFKDHLLSRKN